MDFRTFRSRFASFGKILIDAKTFAKDVYRLFSGTRVSALDTAIGTSEHSALLTAPDCDLTTIWARKFHGPFTWKYCSCTPRAGRHPDYLLAGCSGSCAQSSTLRILTRTVPEAINSLLMEADGQSSQKNRQIQTADPSSIGTAKIPRLGEPMWSK